MILVACVALLMGSFLFVFYVPSKAEKQRQKTRLDFLRERKEVVYENLRDLNFENSAGKYAEDEYLEQRLQMENEAGGILAEIEVLEDVYGRDSSAGKDSSSSNSVA